jgi:hypothetical protein
MSSNRRIEEADGKYNVTTVNVPGKDGRGSTWNEWKGGIKEKCPSKGKKFVVLAQP